MWEIFQNQDRDWLKILIGILVRDEKAKIRLREQVGDIGIIM